MEGPRHVPHHRPAPPRLLHRSVVHDRPLWPYPPFCIHHCTEPLSLHHVPHQQAPATCARRCSWPGCTSACAVEPNTTHHQKKNRVHNQNLSDHPHRMPNNLPGVLERVIATVQATLRRTHDEAGPGAELRLVQSKEDIERYAGRVRGSGDRSLLAAHCMHCSHESPPFPPPPLTKLTGRPSSTAPRGCTGRGTSRALSSTWTVRFLSLHSIYTYEHTHPEPIPTQPTIHM